MQPVAIASVQISACADDPKTSRCDFESRGKRMNGPVDEGGKPPARANHTGLKVAAIVAVRIAVFCILREHWSRDGTSR